jgi:uncharacterized membrane protein
MDEGRGHTNPKPVMDPRGWEAFMNGVFAIAVTLLVLDIHVPDAGSIDSGSALISSLTAQLPRYTAYVLGFVFLGEYWLSTNRTLGMLRGVDHWFLVLGLMFLMVISTVPFATALLAEYIGLDNGRDQVALVIFVSWQLGLAILANILLRYAAHDGRLLKPTVPPSGLRTWLRVAALGPLIMIVALLAAFFAGGTVTLFLIAMVAIVFLFDVPTGDPNGEAA